MFQEKRKYIFEYFLDFVLYCVVILLTLIFVSTSSHRFAPVLGESISNEQIQELEIFMQDSTETDSTNSSVSFFSNKLIVFNQNLSNIYLSTPKKLGDLYLYTIRLNPSLPSKIYAVELKDLDGEETFKLNIYQNLSNFNPVKTKLGSIECQKSMNKDDLLTIVDKQNCLDSKIENYIEFVTLELDGNLVQVNEIIQTDLLKLISAAARDGVSLIPLSGYRSYDAQQTLYSDFEKYYGQDLVGTISAKPGFSEHQLGTAIDLTSLEVNPNKKIRFEDTKAYIWLKENAWEYGFAQSYPEGKTNTTGYEHEAWHWRYIGKMHANELHKLNDFTLSEYLYLLKVS